MTLDSEILIPNESADKYAILNGINRIMGPKTTLLAAGLTSEVSASAV